MKFEKGHTKTGGRKVGTPNRSTTDLKSQVAKLVEQNFSQITTDLATLEPKDRVSAYLKFLEYILPKQREQKIDLGNLSDEQVDDLLEKALNKLEES